MKCVAFEGELLSVCSFLPPHSEVARAVIQMCVKLQDHYPDVICPAKAHKEELHTKLTQAALLARTERDQADARALEFERIAMEIEPHLNLGQDGQENIE